MLRFVAFGQVPASSPTLSTSALAEDVVVVVVSAVASNSGNLTRVRSATDCVVVPGVVSWLGAAGAVVVAVSGSSGGLTCTLEVGPIRMGSRSLRTFNGLLRVTGVGFHGSQNGVQECRVPTPSLHSAFQRTTTNHAILCTDQMLICFAVTFEPNAFEPCGFQFVDQYSWSSTRNCLSNEQHWVLVRRVSNLLVCCCR